MINNLESKSKKELLEIVQIQMDEYQQLQQANDENQSLIGLLEAEVKKLKRERDELRANIELIADICTRDGNSEIFRIAARTKGSLDELKLEQQAKGVKDLKALLNGADWEDSELQMYLYHHIEDMKLKQVSELSK